MPVPTTNQGLILPTGTDLSSPPTSFAAYNTGVESRLVQRYQNAVDRSVRNPTPLDGELSYLISDDVYERASGGTWVTLFSAGAWTSYVPTWGAVSGTGPTIGNGSLFGRYQQIGKTVHMRARVQMGSTSTYGAGAQWTISMPVPAAPSNPQIIFGRIFDTSPANGYVALGHTNTGTFWQLEVNSSSGDTDAVSQGSPITFAASDVIQLQGTYEAL